MKQKLLCRALILVLFSSLSIGVFAESEILTKGQVWEYTATKNGTLYQYSKHKVAGLKKWNGQNVWEINGNITLFGSKNTINEEELLRLTPDYQLLYREIIVGEMHIVTEWKGNGYQYRIFTAAMQFKNKMIPCTEATYLYEQFSPYMMEILMNRKLITVDRQCTIYDEDDQNPFKLISISAGKEEGVQMPTGTVAASSFLIKELDQAIYFEDGMQLIAIKDNRKGLIFFKGNFVKMLK